MKMKGNEVLTETDWSTKTPLDIEFNNVFFSNGFRNYVVSKCGYCPSGLTLDTRFNEDGEIRLVCCRKEYGYESTANNGLGGDMGDYEVTNVDNETYIDCCIDYVNENYTELANRMKNGKFIVCL